MHSKRKNSIGTFAAAITLLWGSLAMPTAHATTTLVFNSYLPPRDPFTTQIIQPWAEAVGRVTDGRVKVVIPPATVTPPEQLWSAVTGGIVDGAYFFNGFFQAQLPVEQIPEIPFTSGNAESTSIAFWKTYQKYFAKTGDYRQVKLLALFTVPAGEIFSMKSPIVTPSDFKGRRLWVLPGVPQRILQHSGAGLVSNAAFNLSELVAGGTVDGIVGVGSYTLGSFKVLPYMKSETRVQGGLSAAGFSLVINRARWDSISPADRKAIERISGVAFARRLGVLDKVGRHARGQAMQHGMKLLKASPSLEAALHRWAAPLRAAWLAAAKREGVNGPAALQYFEAQARAD